MDRRSLVGSRLGKYELHSEIGRGGMGAVYKGYDPQLDRFVAVKVLAPHLAWEQEFVERFLREARAVARLNHPSIVVIHDVGQEGGWYYYAMEYLEGQTLTEIIEERGPLSVGQTVTVLGPLADALDYAHAQGLVHRDIKPGNIIVGPETSATLTDFGIARAVNETRLTQTGSIVGTPEYMSPEQARGSGVDKCSDQYALAVVAYEMLAGHVPFQAKSTPALLHKLTYQPPPWLRKARPNLPVATERALEKALAKEPRRRYESCVAFVSALERSAPTSKTTEAPPSKRTGLWVGLAVGGVLLVGLCATVVGGALALPGMIEGSGRESPSTRTAQPATVTSAITVRPSTPTATTPVDTPTPEPSPTTSTRTPSAGVTPTVYHSLRWGSIGQSVDRNDIRVGVIGNRSGAAMVIIGAIQGDQPNTRDLVSSLIKDVTDEPDRIPDNVALHFVPVLNPDGLLGGTRRNANGVDLNRNWDTFDWTADPDQPGGVVQGAGGSRPHSEPETQSLERYLRQLRQRFHGVRLVLWHSSRRINSGGHVYPGAASGGLDPDALDLARRYARSAGYQVREDWTPYETTGELITWCAEVGIPAIDIVIPGSTSGVDGQLRAITVEALLAIAEFP